MSSLLTARRLFALAALLSLTACATVGGESPRVLSDSERAHEEELIVLAVRNEPAQPAPPAGSTTRGYTAPTDYAVSSEARRLLRDLSRDYGLHKLAEWPIKVLVVQCAVFRIPSGEDRGALLARLGHDARVQLAQPLQSFSTQTAPATRDASPQSPREVAPAEGAGYGSLQKTLEQMSVNEAHHLSTGRGVRVAIVDTGIDVRHPALSGRIESEYNFVDGDAQRFRADRHGTAVGGVIAASHRHGGSNGVTGVAPDARLLALKACWQLQAGRDAARCNSFTLAQALAKAIELKPQIINLSLTGPADPLLQALIQRAVDAGIVVVGPFAHGSDSGFPGAVPAVLSVLRSEVDAPADHTLRAPGDEVLTLVPGGGYDFASGDSLAAAAVSGVSALVLERRRNLQSEPLRRLLDESTVTRVSGTAMLRTVDACLAVAGGTACTAAAR
jgi:hypothetical protein